MGRVGAIGRQEGSKWLGATEDTAPTPRAPASPTRQPTHYDAYLRTAPAHQAQHPRFDEDACLTNVGKSQLLRESTGPRRPQGGRDTGTAGPASPARQPSRSEAHANSRTAPGVASNRFSDQEDQLRLRATIQLSASQPTLARRNTREERKRHRPAAQQHGSQRHQQRRPLRATTRAPDLGLDAERRR
jgi:hypothetical protein